MLPHIIDDWADKAPSNTAFRCAGSALSYAELAEQSDQLAYALKDNGVAPGDRVGIYMHKTIETAAAVFGIMKASAAYVPIDPLAPTRRLADVIRDASIRHLITQDLRKSSVAEVIDAGVDLARTIGLTTDELPVANLTWSDIYSAPTSRRPAAPKPGDMAYLMYTSGSTGEPKGIIHSHESGLSYALFAARTYGLNQSDRLSGFPPLHFDQSTFDYFAGPSAGATTVIIPETYMRLPASLSQLIEAERLSVWYSVPMALIQLLTHGALESRDLTALRWILFGGEPFPVKHLRKLMQLLPQARFSNVYGPAEVNQVTIFNLSRPPEPDEVVPIGVVWENAEGIVMGDDDGPAQDGESGELIVATPAMMSGYWHRPDLTKQAFVRLRSPSSGNEAVFYRTGDIVRKSEDGNLVFLGRRDRQVKIRGHRVELDAVEATMQSFAPVDQAATYIVDDGQGDSTLHAVVTSLPAVDIDEHELRRHLAKRLPRYALPDSIRHINELPLTATGKTDYSALRDQAFVST